MTPTEAEDLAERINAAINLTWLPRDTDPRLIDSLDADRERVASDLAGLQDCWVENGDPEGTGEAKHARRYAAGLVRTANQYGVTA